MFFKMKCYHHPFWRVIPGTAVYYMTLYDSLYTMLCQIQNTEARILADTLQGDHITTGLVF